MLRVYNVKCGWRRKKKWSQLRDPPTRQSMCAQCRSVQLAFLAFVLYSNVWNTTDFSTENDKVFSLSLSRVVNQIWCFHRTSPSSSSKKKTFSRTCGGSRALHCVNRATAINAFAVLIHADFVETTDDHLSTTSFYLYSL